MMNTLSPSANCSPLLEPLLDWIDRELVDTYGSECGRGGNTLLQLRKTLSDKHLNAALGGFYRLLPRLERNHFLLGYRIRRWMSLNFEVLVSDPMGRAAAEVIEIRESDRDLKAHRERFSGDADCPVESCDLRVRVVAKRRASLRALS